MEDSKTDQPVVESGLINNDDNQDMDVRGMITYLWQTGTVLREKAWSSIWKMDLFQSVERVYPQESYYNNITGLACQYPSLIIDGIYVGSAFNAIDYKWLKANQIGLIVNVTSDISNYYPNDFAYVRYETDDLETGAVGDFLDNFVQLIELNPSKKVLVHCFAGKSRSASLVLYYLIKKHGMGFDQALAFLKEKRSSININCRFLDEIKDRLLVK